MSAQSTQNPSQEALNIEGGAAVGASDSEGALMVEFKRLASRAKSIDARLLGLHSLHDSFSRGLPTREESAAKPRHQLLADGRLRNKAKREQWRVLCEIREQWAARLAHSPVVQDRMDRLFALGVTVETPWLPEDTFPLALQ